MYLIQIDDEGEIQRISQQLGSLHDQAPKVMAAAVNATARRSNTLMKQAIRKMYTYSRSDKLKGAFTVSKKASKSNPSATISVSSEVQHLSDFKISPTAPSNSDYGAVKAQVLKKSGMSAISGNGINSFIAKFSSGKTAVVQRIPGQMYKTSSALERRFAKYGKQSDPTRIKALFGPSIPKMAAKVHEDSVDEQTGNILQAEIEKQIAKVIAKQMGGRV
jgi:hypothetical protein